MTAKTPAPPPPGLMDQTMGWYIKHVLNWWQLLHIDGRIVWVIVGAMVVAATCWILGSEMEDDPGFTWGSGFPFLLLLLGIVTAAAVPLLWWITALLLPAAIVGVGPYMLGKNYRYRRNKAAEIAQKLTNQERKTRR